MLPLPTQFKAPPDEIYELLERLCISTLGATNYVDTLRNVANFVSTCPTIVGTPIPFDETGIVAKIMKHLNKKDARTICSVDFSYENDFIRQQTNMRDSNASDRSTLFLHLHGKLRDNQPDQCLRTSILTFLYYMTDQKYVQQQKLENSHRSYDVVTNQFAPPVTSAASLPSRIGKSQKTEYKLNADVIAEYRNSSSQVARGNISKKEYASHTSSGICSDLTSIRNEALVSYDSRVKFDESLKMWNPNHKIHEDLVQNVIYVFTGIEGKFLRKDNFTGKYKLDQRVARSLNSVQCGIIMRLSELGFYHDIVKSFGDPKSGLSALGLMGQAFVSELHEELTQYYGCVALLQEENNVARWRYSHECQNSIISRVGDGDAFKSDSVKRLTLLKILVWYCKPFQRLKWLAVIAGQCQEKKGGALMSTIYNFKKHGQPIVKRMTYGLLVATSKPLYQMLIQWLFEGQITDPYSEFFVECLLEVGPDRLWQDKYRLRTKMLPIFISAEMANKILVIGKSINFLREVCGEKQLNLKRTEFERIVEKNPEYIFAPVPDTDLHSTIDKIYLTTSRHVLDIVTGRHKLFEHLQAMKRYLLLGQGDFISILIDTLKVELDKPGKELYSHDLSTRIDAAIRATNPNHEDDEIFNNLDVRLMLPCEGDVGWDILSLQYTVRGPLATMLEPSMSVYQILFKPLWRMKHMEFILSTKIWKEQMCNCKPLRPLSWDLKKISYRLHMITSEMIHFVYQMQYYILFEVIECNWIEFTERVQQAHSLDDILNAHNEFLNTIRSGIFLDSATGELCQNLETVYDAIKRLEVWQERFYEKVFTELQARKQYKINVLSSEKSGQFGITNEMQLERDQNKKIFEQMMIAYQKSLENIAADYEKAVRCFLLALNSHQDPNLQLFGVRIDFNEYYKKRDQTLSVPLTFEHMRMSNIYFGNKSLLINSRYSTIN